MQKVKKQSFIPDVAKMITFISREPTSKEINNAIGRAKRGAPLFDDRGRRKTKKVTKK